LNCIKIIVCQASIGMSECRLLLPVYPTLWCSYGLMVLPQPLFASFW